VKSIITIPWYGLSCLILQQDWFRYSFSKSIKLGITESAWIAGNLVHRILALRHFTTEKMEKAFMISSNFVRLDRGQTLSVLIMDKLCPSHDLSVLSGRYIPHTGHGSVCCLDHWRIPVPNYCMNGDNTYALGWLNFNKGKTLGWPPRCSSTSAISFMYLI
jgi:hypothetical protein